MLQRRRQQFKYAPLKLSEGARIRAAAFQQSSRRAAVFAQTRSALPLEEWIVMLTAGEEVPAAVAESMLQRLVHAHPIEFPATGLRFLDALFHADAASMGVFDDAARLAALERYPVVVTNLRAALDDVVVADPGAEFSRSTLAGWALRGMASTPGVAVYLWAHPAHPLQTIVEKAETCARGFQGLFLVSTVTTALPALDAVSPPTVLAVLSVLTKLALRMDAQGLETLHALLPCVAAFEHSVFYEKYMCESGMFTMCMLACTEMPWRQDVELVEAAMSVLTHLACTFPVMVCKDVRGVDAAWCVWQTHGQHRAPVLWLLHQLLLGAPVETVTELVSHRPLLAAVTRLCTDSSTPPPQRAFACACLLKCLPQPSWAGLTPEMLPAVLGLVMDTGAVETCIRIASAPDTCMDVTETMEIVQGVMDLSPAVAAALQPLCV
jgi:hypothetical protein